MKVLCNDNKYREFIPAQPNIGKFQSWSKAYCKHCKTKFDNTETELQLEKWKKHGCPR